MRHSGISIITLCQKSDLVLHTVPLQHDTLSQSKTLGTFYYYLTRSHHPSPPRRTKSCDISILLTQNLYNLSVTNFYLLQLSYRSYSEKPFVRSSPHLVLTQRTIDNSGITDRSRKVYLSGIIHNSLTVVRRLVTS